jgi:hypothetical protein
MWILILSILAYSSQGGSSVSSVPGFTSEQSCMVAANVWLSHARNQYQGIYTAKALCVKA